MSVEIEAAADLGNTSLALADLEGQGKGDATKTACANCAVPLVGKYCHACGQVAHVHRSLLHMGEELLHGLLHFDTKAGRTLPMLIAKPGTLTRNYISGQRTRYLSPLGLFLFMVFLMFFVFSFLGAGNKLQSKDFPLSKENLPVTIANQKTAIAKSEAALLKLKADKANAEAISHAEELLQENKAELHAYEQFLQKGGDISKLALPDFQLNIDGNKAKPSEKSAPSPFLLSLQNAAQNPELLLYKLQNTASKFAFMLVPISLPFLWLMFITRRDVSIYDHAVFSLYSLSFMSVLMMLVASAVHFEFNLPGGLLFVFAPPIHMFAQLRGTYNLSKGGALWRTAILLGVAGTVFVLFLMLISYLSVR